MIYRKLPNSKPIPHHYQPEDQETFIQWLRTQYPSFIWLMVV